MHVRQFEIFPPLLREDQGGVSQVMRPPPRLPLKGGGVYMRNIWAKFHKSAAAGLDRGQFDRVRNLNENPVKMNIQNRMSCRAATY